VDNLIDTARRDFHGSGEAVLAAVHGLEEVLQKEFARMGIGAQIFLLFKLVKVSPEK
jgi:hypothetical protein